MTTDIVGPASAVNSTTSRPSDGRHWSTTDSWFVDCSTPNSDDGTELSADWLNGVTGFIRNVIRANGAKADGVTPVVAYDQSDNMLANAILQLIQRGQANYAIDTGSADALIVAPAVALAEYKPGLRLLVLKNPAAGANATTTPTITISGLGQLTIVKNDASALGVGDLKKGAVFEIELDGTYARLTALLTPSDSDRPAISRPGANTSFLITDDKHLVRRSNAGGNMQDQLPTLALVPAGWSVKVRNSDPTGQLILTTLSSINGEAQISVPPGKDVGLEIDGSGYWFTTSQADMPSFQRNSGANLPVTEADRGCLILRSNGGSPMQDSPPGGAGILPNGWYCYFRNIDSAPLVIAPTAGATINGQATITVPPNSDVRISSDGSNYWASFLTTVVASQFTGPKSYKVLATPNGKVADQWGTASGIGAGASLSVPFLLTYNSTGYSVTLGVLSTSSNGAIAQYANTANGSFTITNVGTGTLNVAYAVTGGL